MASPLLSAGACHTHVCITPFSVSHCVAPSLAPQQCHLECRLKLIPRSNLATMEKC